MKRKSPNYYLVLGFTLISFIALLILSGLVYFLTSQAKTESYFDHLTALKFEKKNQLERLFSDISSIVVNIASSTNNPGLYLENSNLITKDLSILTISEYLRQNRNFAKAYIYLPGKQDTVYMIITQNSVKFVHKPLFPKINLSIIQSDKRVLQETVENNSYHLFVSAPLRSINKFRKGYMIIEIQTSVIDEIITGKRTVEEQNLAGEAYILGADGKFRTRLISPDGTTTRNAIYSEAFMKAIKGDSGTKKYKDYRLTNVIGSYSKLEVEGLNWYILTEIDDSITQKSLAKMRNILILLLILFPSLIFIITYKFSSRYTIISKIKPRTTEDLEMIDFLEDRGI